MNDGRLKLRTDGPGVERRDRRKLEADGDAVGGNGRLALMARSVEVSDLRERTPPRRRVAPQTPCKGRRVEPECRGGGT